MTIYYNLFLLTNWTENNHVILILLLQILMNVNLQMTACRSVLTVLEATTVRVTTSSTPIPLTGESVHVSFSCVFFSLLESSCCVLFKLSATIHQVLYRIIVFPVIETIRTGFCKISRVRWVYEINVRVRRTRPLFFCPLSTRVWKTVLQLLSTYNKLSLLPEDKNIPSLSRFSERFICSTHLCFFIAITPCSDDHSCEHVCYKGNNNQATCTCYANFELDSDGNTCRGTYNNYSKQWFNVLLQTRIITQSSCKR